MGNFFKMGYYILFPPKWGTTFFFYFIKNSPLCWISSIPYFAGFYEFGLNRFPAKWATAAILG
jgi:hypothetical protein